MGRPNRVPEIHSIHNYKICKYLMCPTEYNNFLCPTGILWDEVWDSIK